MVTESPCDASHAANCASCACGVALVVSGVMAGYLFAAGFFAAKRRMSCATRARTSA